MLHHVRVISPCKSPTKNLNTQMSPLAPNYPFLHSIAHQFTNISDPFQNPSPTYLYIYVVIFNSPISYNYVCITVKDLTNTIKLHVRQSYLIW